MSEWQERAEQNIHWYGRGLSEGIIETAAEFESVAAKAMWELVRRMFWYDETLAKWHLRTGDAGVTTETVEHIIKEIASTPDESND